MCKQLLFDQFAGMRTKMQGWIHWTVTLKLDEMKDRVDPWDFHGWEEWIPAGTDEQSDVTW